MWAIKVPAYCATASWVEFLIKAGFWIEEKGSVDKSDESFHLLRASGFPQDCWLAVQLRADTWAQDELTVVVRSHGEYKQKQRNERKRERDLQAATKAEPTLVAIS